MGLLGDLSAWVDNKKRVAARTLTDPDQAGLLGARASALNSDLRGGLLAMSNAAGNPDDPQAVQGGINAAMPVAGIFAGPLAKTANKEMLAAAQKMESAGQPRERIHTATGWFRGPDNKWRFEIDDSKAITNERLGDHSKKQTVGEYINHPDLFAAYPDLPAMGFSNETVGAMGPGGWFNPGMNKITITEASGGYPQRQSSMLHELQHAVQEREGFARGGSPDTAAALPQTQELALRLSGEMEKARQAGDKEAFQRLYKTVYGLAGNDGNTAYRHLTGEAEARAVQARSNMLPENRRWASPWASYDVPTDQLITIY